MIINEELTKRFKDPEGLANLLSYARSYRLKSINEMKQKLKDHILSCETFLATNRYYGSINGNRRNTRKNSNISNNSNS